MCGIHALRSVQTSCLKWSEAHTCETNAKWKHRCVKVFPSAAIERSIKSQNNRLCLKSPRSKFAKYPEYCVWSHYDFQFTHTWHFIVWGFLRIAASGIRQWHSLRICFLASDLTNSQSETRSKEIWLWDELACLSGMKTTAMGHILISKNCQMICFNFFVLGYHCHEVNYLLLSK